MQQDQSMEVMEVQDTRDDASLEAVASVGGDDFAAEDDGYNDGYDGEDLEEEEEAAEDHADHVVPLEEARNANEEEFLPSRLADVQKAVKEGRLEREAIATWHAQNPRTEKELVSSIDNQNINIDQMQLQHGKHVEGLQNKIQETTVYAQNLPNEGQVGQFTPSSCSADDPLDAPNGFKCSSRNGCRARECIYRAVRDVTQLHERGYHQVLRVNASS